VKDSRTRTIRRIGSVVTAALACFATTLAAQDADVSLRVEIQHGRQEVHHRKHDAGSGDAVVWLSPLSPIDFHPAAPQRAFTLTQKDKQFTPHLLVVPTGSSVDFPNLDPFFHNVFSLFNGKRFDLGLYEAHTRRSVRFDREGISYIFCNIHPQMGAVVIALSTPFYGISQPDGAVVLHNVTAGSYRLHVWAENVSVEQLAALERDVQIDDAHLQLGVLHLQASGDEMTHHENKFGKDYPADPHAIY
jgi:plastocyanin